MAAASTFQVTISAVDKATASIRKIKASIANVTKPATDLKASFAALGKEVGLDRVAKGVKSIGSAAQNAARHVTSMVPALTAIAGIGTVAGITALATEWGKAGSEIQRTSGVIGVSANDLQVFRNAAKLAGLSAEDMTGGLQGVGNVLNDATWGRNQPALVMMRMLGIEMKRTKDGSVDATRALKDVANAIAARKGNVQAQQLIAGTFGLSALLPMLQKGEKGIDELTVRSKKFSPIIDAKQLAQADRFNENLLKLEGQATKLKYAFGNAMAPAVERVMTAVGKLIDKYGEVAATKVAEYVEKFATWLDHVDWEKTAESVGKFVDAIGGVKGIAIGLAAITFAGPIAGVLSLISNLALLATVSAPTAAAALSKVALPAAAAAAGGYGLGTLARPYYDKYVQWATGGERWSLNDYFTGTNRHDHAATGGYTQEELDSVKDGGGAKLSASSKQRLGAADLFSGLESQYGLPSGLLDGVWSAESSRGKDMLSKRGAKGHFGFMDATAKQYGLDDPNDLGKSADAAARYYRDLLKANGGDLSKAAAAYNWGPGNVKKYGMGALPAETRDYITKVKSQMPGASLYAGQSSPIVAANQSGMSESATAGKVVVEVNFTNAPAGMKSSVRSSGNVSASVNIGNANVTGPSV
ncbi:phage tail tape measure protein [Cupriavidus sp. D39]|uniref:phage tail tape measure protein n=1 Tax=Cupriavidus sp. D39 TaxID=2997877 RepID=UPI0022701BE2|nr:phage tail tape measure protein [Cupriavidus sp. D39]MCY0854342.1 phage tail tape measure protein [Cupriavidus sp. D39]